MAQINILVTFLQSSEGLGKFLVALTYMSLAAMLNVAESAVVELVAKQAKSYLSTLAQKPTMDLVDVHVLRGQLEKGSTCFCGVV